MDALSVSRREASDLVSASEPEVLIVGAGPVGLFAALLLARRGVRVEIVDQGKRPAARSYALLLHPASLRLLDMAGLATEALDRGHRVDRVAFYEGPQRCAAVDLTALSLPFPYAAVVPQQVFEGLLESHFERQGGRVLWRHRVAELRLGGGAAVAVIERLARDGDAVEETRLVRPAVVIGADGAHSAVRRALKASYVEMSPPELFAVFEITADSPSLSEVRIALDEHGTCVLYSLGGNRFRWSFQIGEAGWEELVEPRFKRRVFDSIGEDPFPYIVRERLTELVASRAPWFTDALGEVVWSMAVRFEHRLTGRFGKDNTWLAGDAAHLASPVGAQSMNVGLREAADLAQHLGPRFRNGPLLQTLDGFDSTWRREWRRLLGARGHPSPTPAAETWVRRHAARILPCIPASGDDLDALLRQIGLALPAA
ncbi:MAG TPA: FAD-dependent oxidoreductase [Thermoanaerobaculia bacterium]|nr:FAD-dependent oxidoreductase [Thermoanaerobaculia bacterium]